MSYEPIQTPDQVIIEATDVLIEVVERFRKVETGLDKKGFITDVEALAYMRLLICYVEGFVNLARADLALLPPAYTLAKAAFEGAVCINWLLYPDDPDERVDRLYSIFQDESSICHDEARLAKKYKGNAKLIEIKADQIDSILGEKEVATLPSIEEMLISMREEHNFLGYLLLFRYAHSIHTASQIYKEYAQVGDEMSLTIGSDEVPLEIWHLGFSTCLYSLTSAGTKILQRLGADIDSYMDVDLRKRANEVIGRLSLMILDLNGEL